MAPNHSKMQREPKQREHVKVNETPPPRDCQKQLLWVQAPSRGHWVNVKNILLVKTVQVPDTHSASEAAH